MKLRALKSPLQSLEGRVKPLVTDRQATREMPTNSTRWRKIRARQLMDEPLCRHCRANGRITAANEVDHIDGDSTNNPSDGSNWQSLCKPCHSSKTAREQAAKL